METNSEIHQTTQSSRKPSATRDVQSEKDRIVDRYGAWTTLNWKLAENVYTIGPGVKMSQEVHVRCMTQLISDFSRKPLDQISVVDLASLEGIYSIELALQGAKVLGIEGREGNVEKANFLKNHLKLSNLKFSKDDVRNLKREKYGNFDVVICAGILYHLDDADVFSFLEDIYNVCDQFAIIDTHVAFTSETEVTYKNRTYQGIKYPEHTPDSSLEKREEATYASLDNVFSFWPTKYSLVNALSDVGFTSVLECHLPTRLGDYSDRVFLVAFKGKTISSKIFGAAKTPERYPSHLIRPYSPFQVPSQKLGDRLRSKAASAVRRVRSKISEKFSLK